MIRIILILVSINVFAQDIKSEASFGTKSAISTLHKFGFNDSVGTTLAPITSSGFYRTPTTAVTLAAISDSANDTLAGTGARQIKIFYIDESYNEVSDIIDMNGTTESTDTVTGVLRLLRAFVITSGTYATQTASSHAGTITIQVSGGGDVWGNIDVVDSVGLGQSLIGSYTVPVGYTGFILSTNISVDGSKTASCYLFVRENIDDTTAPYSGTLRLQNSYIGISGQYTFVHQTYEEYSEKTDIGYMCETSTGTTSVSVEFEMILVTKTWLESIR